MRFLGSAIAIALCLVLSGCVTAPPPEPAPTAATSAEPTTTPTPTPSIDPADPGNWVIGFGSLGPVRLGQTATAAIASLPGYTSEGGCEAATFLTKAGAPGIVLQSWPEGVVTQIMLSASGEGADYAETTPRTATGIGIDSTREEFLAAYPDYVTLRDDGPDFAVYAVTDGSGYFLNVGVQEGRVAVIQIRDVADYQYEFCG